MSGKQKALLILLAVALVVLFVIAVGANAGKEKGDPNHSNGFVDWLAKFGAKSSAGDPATVTAGCATVQGQTLILRSAKAFGVEAPAPGDADFTVSDTVEPDPGPEAVAKIAVDKPTEVHLSCPGLNTQCVVTVAAE